MRLENPAYQNYSVELFDEEFRISVPNISCNALSLQRMMRLKNYGMITIVAGAIPH
jgi:hypothetical protein